jgi:nucleotide-binding universal stress UspA family protein
MFSKLLVPLDGSPLAEQVLPHALELARRAQADVTLFCVVPPVRAGEITDDAFVIDADQWLELAQTEAREYLKRVACTLHAQGIKVTTALEVGTPADCILDYAQTMHIDLIAMSTHGRGGIARALRGSVVERVLRTARCPLLLVRANEEGREVVPALVPAVVSA